MNKRELIGEVARRTGYTEEVCTHVLDTFEEVLGDAVSNKVKDASDLMSEAPGSVDEKQLEELGIAIVKSEDSEE